MNTPTIKSFKKIIPMIYAYTTPNDISHRGWTKIGYTDRQSVEDRIKQQTHTADVKAEILWNAKPQSRYRRQNDGGAHTWTTWDDIERIMVKNGLQKNIEWVD